MINLSMKKILVIIPLILIMAGCSTKINGKIAGNSAPNNAKYSDQNNNLSNQDLNINSNQMTEQQNQSQTSEAPEYALIKTSEGDIKARLYSQESPISVENFKKYVSDKFYDGTIFHRVMPGFMIQGGGFDEKGVQKETSEPIKNEAKNGVSNRRGTLSMARTTVVDSATSQFFINLIDNDFLNYRDDANYGYAVFGEVVEGMEVVDRIAQVQTSTKGMFENWPLDNIVIKSIEMVK